jgi:sialic acid synthase SpsE
MNSLEKAELKQLNKALRKVESDINKQQARLERSIRTQQAELNRLIDGTHPAFRVRSKIANRMLQLSRKD